MADTPSINWKDIFAGNGANSIPTLLNAGLNLYGDVNAQNQQQWNNSSLINVLNYLRTLDNNTSNSINTTANAVIPNQINMANALQNMGGPAAQQTGTNLNQILSSLGSNPGSSPFNQSTDVSRVPGLDTILNDFGGNMSGANNVAGNLIGLTSTPSATLQGGIAPATAIAQGSNPNQALLNAIGQGILSSGGTSVGGGPNTSAVLQQYANQVVPNNGMTGNLNYVNSTGQRLTQGNPTVQQALARSSQITNSNPLLSMDQVLSMAQDQSGTQANQQFNALKRQLANTTGITGPMIAGGGNNELLSQLGDQALQNQASAMANARLNQQNLQLGQYGQGINLLNSGVQGDLGYTGQGLNAILQAANQANTNVGTAGNLGLGGGNLQLGNLNAGSGMLNSSNAQQLQAIQALIGLTGQQTQNQTSGAQAIAQLLGVSNTAIGQAGQNLFNLQNLGQTGTQDYFNNLLAQAGQQGQYSNNLLTQGNNYNQIPANYMQQLISLLGQSASSQAGMFRSTPPQNFYQNAIPQQPKNGVSAGGGSGTGSVPSITLGGGGGVSNGGPPPMTAPTYDNGGIWIPPSGNENFPAPPVTEWTDTNITYPGTDNGFGGEPYPGSGDDYYDNGDGF